MKQLELFLDKLIRSGFDWTCNWQHDVNNSRLDHYTIRKNDESIQVIFQIFSGSKGFTNYIESQQLDYDRMITEFNQALRPE
jgi:hypothetical protein